MQSFLTSVKWWVAGAMLAMLPTGRGWTADAPQEQIRKMVADWQGRQDRTRNVRYVLQGKRMIPKGAYTKAQLFDMRTSGKKSAPEEDLITPYSRTVLLDLEHNRLSKDMQNNMLDPSSGVYFPHHRIEIFDGKMIKICLPKVREENSHFNTGELGEEAWLGTEEKGAAVHFEPDDLPMFLAHGMFRTGSDDLLIGILSAPRLRKPVDGTGLSVRGQGVVNGRACAIVRTAIDPQGFPGSFDEYWVDLERDSAIVRMATYARGKVHETIAIDYHRTADGWLPQRWIRTRSDEVIPGAPGEVAKSITMEVKECVVNAELESAEFDLPTRPGMIVMSPDKVPLRVAEDGHTLVALERRGSWKHWLFLFVINRGLGRHRLWAALGRSRPQAAKTERYGFVATVFRVHRQ